MRETMSIAKAQAVCAHSWDVASHRGIMEMEPDIENIMINEYLEYEAEMKKRLRRNVLSKRRPTKFKEADFDFFHQNKSNTSNYPYSQGLPPPYPRFLPVQPHPEDCLASNCVSNDVDIESMTIAEYNLYVAKQSLKKNSLNNHSYGFTPQFFAQPSHTPNTPVDKKDSGLDEILDDLFRIGADNLKRMGQAKVHNGYDDNTSKDTNQRNASICEQEVDNISDLEKEEAQEEDGDDGESYDMWDITVKDVERIRKFLTPNVPDVIDDVTQPLIPKTIHTTPPDEDYVALATQSILDELLKESRDEILNVTMVDEGADFNPTNDIEELERLLAKYPQSYFAEIQVHSVIIKPEPFIHTQPMSPLYRIFKSYKSSTKLYKVKRELTFPPWFSQQGDRIRGHCDSYTGDDHELLESWMLLEEADLKHGLEHDVSSSYRAMLRGVSFFNSTLILDFSFPLLYNRDIEENEHLSKRREIWTWKQAKEEFQGHLRRNHPAGVTPNRIIHSILSLVFFSADAKDKEEKGSRYLIPTLLHPSLSRTSLKATMPKSNKDKSSTTNFKRTARISVRACCFVNPRLVSPPYQPLSPPTDYQTDPSSTPNVSPPLSPITSPGISLRKLLTTPKSTPPPLTLPPPAPTQPSKTSSPLAINLDPVEIIFLTPPTSPHSFFDSLEDLPPRTTNPLPPRPSFESIERLAN
ncbi:hypothetical protein Tco_0563300 [Tanacetum coccineum]